MRASDAFLLTNIRWVEDYHKSTGNPDGTKQAWFETVLNDFSCSFAIDVAGTSHSILYDLGNKAWQRTGSGVMTRKSLSIMEREEYPLFLEDPVSFIHKVALPRLYEDPIEESTLRVKAGVYYKSILDENRLFVDLAKGGKFVRNMVLIGAPLDLLGDFLRGTKGLLTDLHTCSPWVDQACETLVELVLRQADVYKKHYGMKDLLLPLHLPALLSRKDYLRFYHPSYRLMVERLLADGYRIMVLAEGNVERFVDLLAEVDNERLLIHFETTPIDRCIEPFEGKATRFAGFYPTHLLRYASEAECLDEARRLDHSIKGLENYVFTTNKVLLSGEDTQYSSVRSVYDYFCS
jgi:hypothetical protein